MSTLAVPLHKPVRVHSIDLLRGIIMVIMALDHVRDYFHADAFFFDPLDLEKTNTALFLTRWITHFCAPVFMLLTGASAFLVGERKGKKALSRFLLTRGLFLVVLEFTLINFGWFFNPRFPEFDFIVIWSLGISMIVLAGLIYLPRKWIFLTGILLVFGHNLLDRVHVGGGGLDHFAWCLLHEPGFFQFAGKNIFVGYPILPWVGVIALGYSVGSLYSSSFDAARRKRWLLRIGMGAILLFIVLRFSNLYGDAQHWSQQSSGMFTVLSFIDTVKYPPSLLYLLMTLGPALIFLAFSETPIGWLGKKLSVYGRVPMFYYILHIYLIHLLAMGATYFCNHSWEDMILGGWGDPKLQGYGFSLGITYLVWIGVVLLLYPLCRWYDRYKTAHKEKWWLSYL